MVIRIDLLNFDLDFDFEDIIRFGNSSVSVRKRLKKSRIRETKHPSTDADSSNDVIGGWTKNTPKPDFFEKQKKSPKTQKLRNV